MGKHSIKFNKKLILKIIPLCLLIFWFGTLIKCEILTALHGKEVIQLLEEHLEGQLVSPDFEYIKILNYSKKNIKVYCISKGYIMGNIFTFTKNFDQNKFDGWNWEQSCWSKAGTADTVIWPYWWHFIYFAWS